jgi:hypothetical protein
MPEERTLPDANRLSVLTATVLLAFALTRLIDVPQYTAEVQLPNMYLFLDFNLNTITTLLAAGLTATGMEWLLRGHPSLQGRPSFQHWLLPTLTAFIIGTALALLPAGAAWWLGFGFGALLLVLVFLAEYVVVEPADVLYPSATVVLIAFSFAVFLILAVALRYAGLRLFLLLPALLPAAGLVVLRSLHLRLSGRWEFAWAAGAALVIVQLAAALQYWPVSPIQYGLLLLGPLYALNGLAAGLAEELPLRRAAVEPALMLAAVLGLAFWFR